MIVEDGVAAKTMAAYIDLNPVRAGMVKNPEDYRWSSYGEAIGGGAKGNGKKARAGLARAVRAHLGVAADASFWAKDVALEYRNILLAGVEERVERSGAMKKVVKRKGLSKEELDAEKQRLMEAEEKRMGEIPFGRMLRCRVRYFTDGAVIGSNALMNETFQVADTRPVKCPAKEAKNPLRTLRDLRVHL